MPSLTPIALAIALALTPGHRTASDEINALPTADVAAALLAPDEAATIVGHFGEPPDGMLPPVDGFVYRVRLTTAPVLGDYGLCWRRAFIGSAERDPDRLGYFRRHGPSPFAVTEVAVGPDCENVRLRYAQADTDVEASASLLAQVSAMRDDAREGRAIRVNCASEVASVRCPRDLRTLLATLPLETAWAIVPSRSDRTRLALIVDQQQRGGDYWEVSLTEGDRPVLHLERLVPFPF